MGAQSSATFEFWGMAQVLYELPGLKITYKNLKIKWDESIRLYCDKKSAISTKWVNENIEVDRHFTEEKLERNTPYVSTHGQLAKGLSSLDSWSISYFFK